MQKEKKNTHTKLSFKRETERNRSEGKRSRLLNTVARGTCWDKMVRKKERHFPTKKTEGRHIHNILNADAKEEKLNTKVKDNGS